MRRLLGYSGKVDNSDPRLSIYRVFGIDVQVDYAAPDIDQALADKFGMTKVDFLAAETEFDDLKAQVAAALASLDSDEIQRADDLAALTGADLPTTKAIIGRSLQREGRSIVQRRRLIKVVARLVLNDERPQQQI